MRCTTNTSLPIDFALYILTATYAYEQIAHRWTMHRATHFDDDRYFGEMWTFAPSTRAPTQLTHLPNGDPTVGPDERPGLLVEGPILRVWHCSCLVLAWLCIAVAGLHT